MREWILMWAEEFNGPAGAPANPGTWEAETGGHGWGNDELQYYTASGNAALDGESNLAIAVRRSDPRVYSGRAFTSARLISKGRFAFKHGLVEVRMRVAAGRGIWPAVWMLGHDLDDVGWPQCGEIDVMEHFGTDASHVQGTIHGPGYCGSEGVAARHDTGMNLADDFHVYAVDWEPGRIRWYLDGRLYGTATTGDVRGNPWVFEHDFFLLVSVAVGGTLSEAPGDSTPLPQVVLVDYIRVSARQPSR